MLIRLIFGAVASEGRLVTRDSVRAARDPLQAVDLGPQCIVRCGSAGPAVYRQSQQGTRAFRSHEMAEDYVWFVDGRWTLRLG